MEQAEEDAGPSWALEKPLLPLELALPQLHARLPWLQVWFFLRQLALHVQVPPVPEFVLSQCEMLDLGINGL